MSQGGPDADPDGRGPDRVRKRVWVAGRVQGVWFRESCRRTALHHGVAGWVRNLPDGRVEAVFEGPEPAVGTLVDWCRTGPRRALVTRVEVRPETPDDLAGFEVL